MKHSLHLFTLLIVLMGLSLHAETISEQVADNSRSVNPYEGSFSYEASSPVDIQLPNFSLTADSGSLLHGVDIQVSMLPYKSGMMMQSNMENVCLLSDGVRLLPNGEHFSEDAPALVTLAYDPARIPMGYTPKDIYTYYSDDNTNWHRLERAAVDTVAHTIISYTTHFTDFANAVIKVPEMPESKAYVPTTMTDLPDVDPMQGIPMVEAPTANNRGTAELTYPIELPKGRHGMQPNVDLHYSSAGGNGILGVGWSLSTPAITIDTRWGVPRYDPIYETEQYLVNGAAVVLRESDEVALPLPYQDTVFQRREDHVGRTRFYARDTKNQDRIIRYGTNPTNYYWTVTDRNGITTFYGRTFDPTNPRNAGFDESNVVRTDSGCIAYWAATASVDVHGNYILYKNENIANNIYVKSIDYTGNYLMEIPALYRVYVNYKDDRMDVSTNGRLGVLQTENRLICNIVLQHLYPKDPKDFEYIDNLAAYYMQYSQPADSNLFKSRLEKIVMLDSIHYILSKEFDDCSLERIMHGEVLKNKLLEEKIIEAERNRDMQLYHQLQEMKNQPYGETSIPASITKFSYANAPSAGNLFGGVQRFKPEKKSLSNSHSISWGVGGTATVGLGVVVPLTILTAGGNYEFSKGEGGTTSMLMDLDGDGLQDIVYEDKGYVYYCKQEKHGSIYSFKRAQIIYGLTRLSHEVSNTHTWGLQLSFGANLSYSNPITTSYTDVYFSDINADGLPDMIDGDQILINQLRDGVPVFGSFAQKIVPSNSNCEKGIIFNGEVDEHIECNLQEILVDSYPLEDNTGYNDFEPEIVHDDIMEYPKIKKSNYDIYIPQKRQKLFEDIDEDIDELRSKTPEIPEPNYTGEHSLSKRLSKAKASAYVPATDDSLIYRIENGRVNVYKQTYDCRPIKVDPDIETVRVWVAPKSAMISLTDSIMLLEDMTESRTHSLKADGVTYSIQHCHSVTASSDSTHLNATSYSLLKEGALDANDYEMHSWESTFYVEEGDVLMFRLRSGENNRFDRTRWKHIIQYQNDTSVFDSEKDFVCTGESYFQALNAGTIHLSFDGRNEDVKAVSLKVIKENTNTSESTYLLDTILQHGAMQIPVMQSPVQSDDRIIIRVDSIQGSSEPRWSDFHLFPKLQYLSSVPMGDGSNSVVLDTITYYPDVQIYPSTDYSVSSPYRKLFGVLHKCWGEFAYQPPQDSLPNIIIILDSLVNTQLLAAERIKHDSVSLKNYKPNIPSLETTEEDELLSCIDNTFSNSAMYSPINESNRWISMRADSRTERYITYGNMGCIGRELHSNAREYTTPQNNDKQVADIVEYDSSIPFAMGTARKNNFVRKQTKSIQHNFSAGLSLPVSINKSASFGTYDVVVDYMDMNGDGFPDFVGKGGIQYSKPWGGIGKLQTVKN